MVKYVSTNLGYTIKKKKKKNEKKMCEDSSNNAYAMFLCFFSSDFLYKSICCGNSFELHRQVDAIQMGTYNICFYEEVNRSTLDVI